MCEARQAIAASTDLHSTKFFTDDRAVPSRDDTLQQPQELFEVVNMS
jgi:hypothetical protein